MFEKLQAGEKKIHDAPRQPRTCSHPIYARTLTGVCQAIRIFSPCFFHAFISTFHVTQNISQLHKQCNVDPSDLLTFNTSFITRGHNLKLYKLRTSSRVRSSFFTMRAINYWNNLSYTVINAPSVNMTGFWKISPNVTFCISNIYNQNKEWELSITSTVVKICSSHLELPKNHWKYY